MPTRLSLASISVLMGEAPGKQLLDRRTTSLRSRVELGRRPLMSRLPVWTGTLSLLMVLPSALGPRLRLQATSALHRELWPLLQQLLSLLQQLSSLLQHRLLQPPSKQRHLLLQWSTSTQQLPRYPSPQRQLTQAQTSPKRVQLRPPHLSIQRPPPPP